MARNTTSTSNMNAAIHEEGRKAYSYFLDSERKTTRGIHLSAHVLFQSYVTGLAQSANIDLRKSFNVQPGTEFAKARNDTLLSVVFDLMVADPDNEGAYLPKDGIETKVLAKMRQHISKLMPLIGRLCGEYDKYSARVADKNDKAATEHVLETFVDLSSQGELRMLGSCYFDKKTLKDDPAMSDDRVTITGTGHTMDKALTNAREALNVATVSRQSTKAQAVAVNDKNVIKVMRTLSSFINGKPSDWKPGGEMQTELFTLWATIGDRLGDDDIARLEAEYADRDADVA